MTKSMLMLGVLVFSAIYRILPIRTI